METLSFWKNTMWSVRGTSGLKPYQQNALIIVEKHSGMYRPLGMSRMSLTHLSRSEVVNSDSSGHIPFSTSL